MNLPNLDANSITQVTVLATQSLSVSLCMLPLNWKMVPTRMNGQRLFYSEKGERCVNVCVHVMCVLWVRTGVRGEGKPEKCFQVRDSLWTWNNSF